VTVPPGWAASQEAALRAVSRRLIERRRSSEDRRRHLVELTTAGANRLAQAESALATIEDEVLGHLDAEQRETLYRLLHQATSDHVVDCGCAVDDR
jgi:DNA-binding MarR family transcriptional regulator